LPTDSHTSHSAPANPLELHKTQDSPQETEQQDQDQDRGPPKRAKRQPLEPAPIIYGTHTYRKRAVKLRTPSGDQFGQLISLPRSRARIIWITEGDTGISTVPISGLALLQPLKTFSKLIAIEEDVFNEALDARYEDPHPFLVVGKFSNNRSDPRELYLQVPNPEYLFSCLFLAVIRLQGFEVIFSLKDIEAFGLYEVP